MSVTWHITDVNNKHGDSIMPAVWHATDVITWQVSKNIGQYHDKQVNNMTSCTS